MKYGELRPGDLIHDIDRGWLVIDIEIDDERARLTYYLVWNSVEPYQGIIRDRTWNYIGNDLGKEFDVIRYK